MKFTLVTPEKKYVEDLEVEEVIVPGHRGELNILEGHSPLVTTLSTGILRYKTKDSGDFVKAVVSWGYCEVGAGKVLVLAETVDTKDKIDLARVEESLRTSEEKLHSGDLNPDGVIKYQRKIKRALARKDLSQS